MARPWSAHFAESTAGRIVMLLRRGGMTIDELAEALGLTANGVRLQVAALERDGIIMRAGKRPTASKPSAVYSLTPDTELQFSRVYAPMLTELLHVLSQRQKPSDFRKLMRDVGAALMADRPRPRGTPRERAEAACALFNELGGHTIVERRGGKYLIRSYGCPLSAATLEHPEACVAMEGLLGEFTGAPVKSCCARDERLRCCFELFLENGKTPRARA